VAVQAGLRKRAVTWIRARLVVEQMAASAGRRDTHEGRGHPDVTVATSSRNVGAVEGEPRVRRDGRRCPGVGVVTVGARLGKRIDVGRVRGCVVRGGVTRRTLLRSDPRRFVDIGLITAGGQAHVGRRANPGRSPKAHAHRGERKATRTPQRCQLSTSTTPTEADLEDHPDRSRLDDNRARTGGSHRSGRNLWPGSRSQRRHSACSTPSRDDDALWVFGIGPDELFA